MLSKIIGNSWNELVIGKKLGLELNNRVSKNKIIILDLKNILKKV